MQTAFSSVRLVGVRRIGLLGGMSWESSAEYYRLVNEAARDRLGGLHSADCVLRSVDDPGRSKSCNAPRIGSRQASGSAAEARLLEAAGCELLVLCTNTMHKVADVVTAAVGVQLVHIADATADVIRAAGLSTVGLLATAYTMEQDFYVGRLRDMHGLGVLVPDRDERRLVHDVIYDELCVGVIKDASREAYRAVIANLVDRGAEGILLGCTEIGLLIGAGDVDVSVFDTTIIHAQRAVELALAPAAAVSPGPDLP